VIDPESRAAARDLIGALIRRERQATPEDVEAIRDLMATAPFDPGVVSVAPRNRGRRYRGVVLGARAQSLAYHLFQRTAVEQQWADHATEAEYVADLRNAVRAPSARLGVYERRGGNVAAALVPTTDVIPPAGLGSNSLPFLLVVYSADRDMIVTGYQCSSLDEVSIPEEARWLTD
jgi:hypothetical protein